MRASDKFSSLRGGLVYAAASVESGTARAWVANNGLQLGVRESPQAHPRYDLADATRLLIMRFLTARHGIRAQAAADIVNAVAGEIRLAANAELDRMDDPHFQSNFEHYIVAFSTTEHTPEVRTLEEHLRCVKDQTIVSETVIDLRAATTFVIANFANASAMEGFFTSDDVEGVRVHPAQGLFKQAAGQGAC